MPNRIVRNWTQSDKVNSLDAYAERFFTRLIMTADDHGCFSADLRLLRANLFPLLIDSTVESDILLWVTACEDAGLILLYKKGGKKFLQIVDFGQRLDKARSKFPQYFDRDLDNDSLEKNNEPLEEKNSQIKPFLQVVVNQSSGDSLDISTESLSKNIGSVPRNRIRIRKESESEKESEGENSASPVFSKKNIVFPFESENFKFAWEGWRLYKLQQHKFSFKSVDSEQISLKNLSEISKNSEEAAIAIIQASIANGWKGLFEIKNFKNETVGQNGHANLRTGVQAELAKRAGSG